MLGSGLGPGDWVTTHARYTPGSPCLVRGDGTVLTYADVNRQVTRLGHALRSAGIGPADRVAILAVDSPEYVILQLACMKLGATFVALNFRLSAPEIANLLRAADPIALFLSSRYLSIADAAMPAIQDGLRLVASFDDTAGRYPSFADVIAGAPSEAELESVATDEDILSLAFTSGTTGTPKGVLQSQRMIQAMTISGVIELGIRPEDLIYSGAPLFHVAGIGHLLYGLARGAASLVLPQFDADLVLDWLQSDRLQHVMLVPSMIIALLEKPHVADSRYEGLRSIMYGGAPMTPAVIRKMSTVFECELYNGFGAGTEAGGQTMFRPIDHRRALAGDEHLLGSIGKPAFGCDVKLCDPAGREVASGQIGEIYSRSNSLMSGYLGQPELSTASVRGGWFHAGDLAWRDKEGYLFLAGRADDMIIRGGENVYPIEIEDVLANHPLVLEVAIVGEPDPVWGEAVTAVARVVDVPALTIEELTKYCRGRLASYKIPQRLVVTEELPKNSTGKIDKAALRQALASKAIS